MGYSIKVNNIDEALNLTKLVNLRSNSINSVMSRKFRDARKYEREFAQLAVEDFNLTKKLPFVQIKNAPLLACLLIKLRYTEYRIFKLFTKKTPDEKQLSIMAKDYMKGLTSEETKARTYEIKA